MIPTRAGNVIVGQRVAVRRNDDAATTTSTVETEDSDRCCGRFTHDLYAMLLSSQDFGRYFRLVVGT